jgi:2-methylcitrate dehydratase PrpD
VTAGAESAESVETHPASASDSITRTVAAYSRSTEFASLPDDVVDRTKRVIADELGCMVLGATMPPGERMASYVRSIGGNPDATVIGGGFRAPAGLAALANGTSSHSDELDGVHISQGHPAGTSVAGVFAMCESLGLGGRDLVNGVVLSYDVGGRMLMALGGGHALRKAHRLHSSQVYAVGVAAAAGRLLQLEQLALQHAMALGAMNVFVPSAFYNERNHMSKAMNQGQAAYAGINGAVLASHGFEAHDEIIETTDGLLDVWRTDQTDPAVVTAGLGSSFSVMDAGFKYYSAGYPIHAPIAGALQIMADHNLAPADIARIRVGMSPSSADVVDSRTMPSISLQHMLSLAMVLGQLGYDDAHRPGALDREDVQRLRGMISIVRDPDIGADAAKRRLAWVEITTGAGEVIRGPARIAPGHWELGGMPWDDLHAKFVSIVAPRLGATAGELAFAMLRESETLTDLAPLAELLIGPADAA